MARRTLSTSLLFLFLLCLPGPAFPGPVPLAPPPTLQVQNLQQGLPLYFIANQGQLEQRVKFYEQGPGHAIYFTPDGILFTLERRREPEAPFAWPNNSGNRNHDATRPRPADRVRLIPLGMGPGVEIVPLDAQEAMVHYLIGNAPDKWRTHIPTYKAVLYREAYPGIDLKFYGAGRQLEYDIIVKPGADPAKIRFRYEGIAGLEVNGDGDLVVQLPGGGDLLQKKPVVYQELSGNRLPREGRFRIIPGRGRHTYGFALAGYDCRASLVIDPMLVFGTFLGSDCAAQGIALDANNDIYLTGYVGNSYFPIKNPLPGGQYKGNCDAFITKMKADGSALVYSTYLGGTGDDYANGIAVDSAGRAYVAGYTDSADFPVTFLPMQSKIGGQIDAFVSKLAADGSALVYSTYQGGTANDYATAIAVAADGSAFVTGYTFSADFPTSASQQGFGGVVDAFVTHLTPDGALQWSTYLGGSSSDYGLGLAVQSNGTIYSTTTYKIYVTGNTSSPDLPTTPAAFQTVPQGGSDAFVCQLIDEPAFPEIGRRFRKGYCTYLGGSSNDSANAVAPDQGGNAYVAGRTDSVNFPRQKAFQTTLRGGTDGFVAKLNADGKSLAYSTYLGGSADDYPRALAVDQNGCAYAAGQTFSADFPTRNSWQPFRGTSDAFVAKLAPSGSALEYATLLGGSSDDYGYSKSLAKI